MDLADAVGTACVEENSLCCRSLTGVDMGHDADIANPL
jgi:hypothetical protein